MSNEERDVQAFCNAVFKVLKKRIREGEVFGLDEKPDQRRRKEITNKWKKWLRTTEARHRKPKQ